MLTCSLDQRTGIARAPLSKASARVPWLMLLGRLLVLSERNRANQFQASQLGQAFAGIGIEKLDVALEVGSTVTLVEMLGRGKHVSYLSRFAVKDKVAADDLYHLKVTGFGIQRSLWFARNCSHLNHPVAEAFIGMLLHSPISYV
ncbi:MAG: LysR substrate-binding domain-containing protein [Pseudomonadota bacterium]